MLQIQHQVSFIIYLLYTPAIMLWATKTCLPYIVKYYTVYEDGVLCGKKGSKSRYFSLLRWNTYIHRQENRFSPSCVSSTEFSSLLFWWLNNKFETKKISFDPLKYYRNISVHDWEGKTCQWVMSLLLYLADEIHITIASSSRECNKV